MNRMGFPLREKVLIGSDPGMLRRVNCTEKAKRGVSEAAYLYVIVTARMGRHRWPGRIPVISYSVRTLETRPKEEPSVHHILFTIARRGAMGCFRFLSFSLVFLPPRDFFSMGNSSPRRLQFVFNNLAFAIEVAPGYFPPHHTSRPRECFSKRTSKYGGSTANLRLSCMRWELSAIGSICSFPTTIVPRVLTQHQTP